MSGYKGISVERREKVGYVFFDNPEKQNSMGYLETKSLTGALRDFDADGDIRVIILSGKGEFFCSGGKIDGFPEGPLLAQDNYSEAGIELINTFMGLKKPIIAAVNATTLAGGVMFMEMCDLAVAGQECMFGLPEVQRGYFPMLALAVLEKAIPKKILLYLAYTGKMVTAAQMMQWNLVNEVVPQSDVLKRAEALAQDIAALSPMPARFGREAYYKMYGMNLTDAMNYSKHALLSLLWTDDVRETGRAGAEGRPPVFKGQ